MKTFTIEEWIRKDHGRRLVVDDPEQYWPTYEYLTLIIESDDGYPVAYGLNWRYLKVQEPQRQRVLISRAIKHLRLEIRKQRGEGVLIA